MFVCYYILRTTRDDDNCCNTLQVQRTSGMWFWAEYSTFSISDEADKYRLTVAGYSGDAGDAIAAPGVEGWIANGMRFSTKDEDHDEVAGDACAWSFHSGWWFRNCAIGVLNHDENTSWSVSFPAFIFDIQAGRMLVKVE